MPFARLAATAVVLLGLAIPATAGARSPTAAGIHPAAPTAAASPKASAILGLAAGIARRYWGAVPCGGAFSIVSQRPLTRGAESGTDAWVTFTSPLGANDLAAPATTYTSCTIAFGRDRWPTAESMRQDWDMLCLTMVHEMGHLLGHPHDTTPRSVMAPVFTDLSSEPPLCRTVRPSATA